MILIIDNYDSFTYNLYQLISSFGCDVKVVRNDKITIPEIEKMNPDGIILSPGPKAPKDAGIIVELIQKLGSKYPILGVCLGHQAIAEAFGGNVVQCHEIVHGKSAYVFHQRKGLFEDVSLPLEAGRYHSLIVEKGSLPSQLEIDAENEEGIIMALKHKKYPVYGIQFHPESVLTPEGEKLVKHFFKICEEKEARKAC